MQVPPLILTVMLDEESQQFFNSQRKQYFPPERNFIQAHLTLFHHLPNDVSVIDTVENICKHQHKIDMAVTDPVSIGKGVAYKLNSTQLMLLHKQLQKTWHPLLTPQDQQGLWPHITIQNKVSAAIANSTRQAVAQSFVPFTAFAFGLVLWEYLNGPWRLYQQFLFTD